MSDTEKKQPTFADLKNFVNGLSDEQLKEPVILWREEEGVTNIEGMVLEKDHYTTEGETHCFPEDEATEEQKNEGLELEYKKGTPILWEDF